MATPAIEANLSPTGESFAAASKKPLYSAIVSAPHRPAQSAIAAPRRVLFKESASPIRQPKYLQFGAVQHPRLRVLKGIPVQVSFKRGNFTAVFRQVDEFGQGPSLSLALDDLGKTLAELFLSLSDRYDALGSDLKSMHDTLSRYFALRQR